MRVTVDLGETENSCFVIMPFNPMADVVYREVYQPAIEAAGLKAVRADEIYGTKRIMQDVWDSIRKSRMVLAELSGRNENVLYELGLAHATGKQVLLVTLTMEDVPFDLKDVRCIVYEKDHPTWGTALERNVTDSLKSAISTEQAPLLSHIEIEGELPEEPSGPIEPRSPKPAIVLSGEWVVKESWADFDRETRFYLTQEGGTVTGLAVTQRPDGKRVLVIKQTLSGRLDDTQLNLVATSSETLAGSVGDWSLETWQARIDPASDVISGIVSDSYDNSGVFEMTRSAQAPDA
jgi:hypothetical protein